MENKDLFYDIAYSWLLVLCIFTYVVVKWKMYGNIYLSC